MFCPLLVILVRWGIALKPSDGCILGGITYIGSERETERESVYLLLTSGTVERESLWLGLPRELLPPEGCVLLSEADATVSRIREATLLTRGTVVALVVLGLYKAPARFHNNSAIVCLHVLLPPNLP